MMKRNILALLVLMCLPVANGYAQEELIKFADFEQWMQRDIKESRIIGGATKTIFEIAPAAHWTKENGKQNVPYTNQGGSPWATSNVYAHVSGINKTNICVYRDTHNNGYCAKLQTHIEKVKALGVINVSVLASGSIFTGEMIEPIKNTDNPMSKMSLGIPFTRCPKAIKLDYKVHLTGEPNRIRRAAFSKVTTVQGKDMPEMIVILQARSEDANGNITARRVGTLIYDFAESTSGWVENKEFTINYGNITSEPFFTSKMGLFKGDDTIYARNSKGNVVPVKETGWAPVGTAPTHAIVKFDSSCGGAYVGTVGTTIWLDNIRWVF